MNRQLSIPTGDRAEIPGASASDDPVVVVGGGPAGNRVARELSRRGLHVVLLNAERWAPYNRVQLTPLLAGEAQLGQVFLDETAPGPGRVDRYDGVSVVDIDRAARRVRTSTGRVYRYSDLVLATGARAFVPGIGGAKLDNVHVFRSFNDAEALAARLWFTHRVVVIGGGLLGLEAARGMARGGAEITVIEHENRLMPRQIDAEAYAVLRRRIETLGISVRTGARVARLEGATRVERVVLDGGETLDADTVIFCTGVRANTQLAAAAGLGHRRGVLVDDRMRTADPHVYAVGECAEHAGIVHGLVGPGYAQAGVAAAAIAGEDAAYAGSTPAFKLKVLGVEVFSMGDFESAEQEPSVTSRVWTDAEAASYRRIFVRNGRLIAALGVGPWDEATRLQRAVADRVRVRPWHIWRFARSGRLWPKAAETVAAWPDDAIVCNCTATTKGAILAAVADGAGTLDAVRSATAANSVCGSCKPRVVELLGGGAVLPEPVRWWRAVLWISGLAALLALGSAALPRVPVGDSFRPDDLRMSLWFDSIWKQWTGFALLALTVAAAAIGLRKRIGWLRRLGSYEGWRIVHLAIGVSAAIGLAVHTGFRPGANLNLALMLSFVATLIFGAVAGLATGAEHRLHENGVARPRTVPLWLHVLALWPLPVLLAVHILSVYTY